MPNKYICGLSKLARVVDKYSHKPQLQERLTIEILDFIVNKLEPIWCMVIVEAEHLCMSMRGIKKPGHKTITNAIYPSPQSDKRYNHTKLEFLRMIGK